MNTFLNLLHKILQWLGIDLIDEFSDTARAGRLPKNFDWKLHRQVATLKASLIYTKKDCVFVDLSKWQGDINFVKLVESHVKAVILKAGQGTVIDPRFIEYYKAAKAAGLKVGQYWYFDSRVDPRKQADTWANIAKQYPADLPYFFDYEERYGGDYAGIVNLASFLLRFQALTGVLDSQIGIYTGYFYWNERGSQDPFWKKYHLWIAWYGHESDVIIPKPWTQAELFGWQFTDHADGIAYGVSSKELDLNFFVKGLEEFERLYGETGEAPPPGTGEEGMFSIVSDSYNMSLRQSNTVDAAKIEAVPMKTVMICDRINVPPTSGGFPTDKWAHVISINGIAKNGWVAQVHLGDVYCRIVDEPAGTNPRATVLFTDADGKEFIAENVELKPK